MASTTIARPLVIVVVPRYEDLLMRWKELDNWTQDFSLPAVVWLGGLFNPQSLLTAIMQVR
jgi:dynein heavy chain